VPGVWSEIRFGPDLGLHKAPVWLSQATPQPIRTVWAPAGYRDQGARAPRGVYWPRACIPPDCEHSPFQLGLSPWGGRPRPRPTIVLAAQCLLFAEAGVRALGGDVVARRMSRISGVEAYAW